MIKVEYGDTDKWMMWSEDNLIVMIKKMTHLKYDYADEIYKALAILINELNLNYS